MSIISNALLGGIGFIISSIPFVILNLYIINKKRTLLKMKYTFIDKIFTVFFISSLLAIFSVTIGNNNHLSLLDVSIKSINFNLFDGISGQYAWALDGDIYSILNLFGNIAMFIPWGFFLGLYMKNEHKSTLKVIIIALITSSFIEVTQLFTGRYADITDIALNTIGVIIGKFIFNYFNILFNVFWDKVNIKCIDNNNNKDVFAFEIVHVICCIIFIIANIY